MTPSASKALERISIALADERYPAWLRAIPDPPAVLHCEGRIEPRDRQAVAIVGARRATPYGLQATETLARELSGAGFTIVSGLARGIDAAAHRGAVRGETKTVAVLGSGLGALYPPYHRQLADEIIAGGGAIVSEFPLSAPARPFQFPMRNRLVAALAEATLVVEAGPASGALITARLAGDLGRQVFAIPGDIGRSSSVGTNELIKDGVALATGAADIASVLGWERITQKTAAMVRDDQLLKAIAPGGSSIDELCATSGLDPGSIAARLTVLEMQGLVEAQPGGLYTHVE
jgi:DNA processing protein